MLTDESTSGKTRRIRKIFTVFLLGIIIPAGFLSFWGFRSFQYERLLMQKQSEERFAATGDLLEQKIGEQLSTLTTALNAVAQDESVQHMDVPKMIQLIFSVKTLAGLPVDNLFVFDEKDVMVAPWLASAKTSQEPMTRELDWGLLSEDERKAEHFEFVDKNVPQAIEAYKSLQAQVSSPPLQAALLKNLAGCYRKSNQDRMAEVTYLKLLDDYDQVLDFSGYPMGVLSLQLLASLYASDKAWTRSLDVQLDLYEGVVLNRWSLNEGQRTDLINGLARSIAHALSTPSESSPEHRVRWEKVQTVQSKLLDAEPKARSFVANEWSGLLKRLSDRGWLERGGVLDLSPSQDKREIAVVVPVLAHESVHRLGYMVALLPAEPFWVSTQRSMLALVKPVGLQIESNHFQDGARSTSFPATFLGKPAIDRNVSGVDPPFHFRLMDSIAGNPEQFFWRRRLIYCGMITLSFVVIVVGLTTMAQAMRRETEVANLKADFVANVSHELRTPLTAISHIGERLRLGRVRSEAERDEFYSLLGKETKRLRNMIEDILDFSKMLAGQKLYRRERIDLSKVLLETQESFKGKAIAGGFEVSFEMPLVPVTIVGDSRALVVAVLNILDNAIKYSGESRKVSARLLTRARKALIEVQDYGIGIAEVEQQRIFEKFYRVEHTAVSGSERGVGLGLSMVQHIMDGHEGRIRVESKLGEGSVFTLEFPLAEGD